MTAVAICEYQPVPVEDHAVMGRAQWLLHKANNGIALSQHETTELLNLAGVQISETRVWQLHKRAIKKLRDRLPAEFCERVTGNY